MSEILKVLSGIRATGRLHFGNFLGAVQNFVKYQKDGNICLYFIADWHTLTTLENPEELRTNLTEIVKDYLAAGLDPDKSIIYAQSSIPEISELCLYLSMLQPLGELQTIPTYKELVRKFPNRVTLGLLTYPVLMAADILGPKATLVPVGEDQVPNVELARDLAKRFNNRYGKTFPIPEMMQDMVRIPGLDGEKMGKSDADNSIDINASIEEIRRRYLTKGVTDKNRVRASDPGDPYNGCKSVYPIHELVTVEETENRQIAKACQAAAIGCAECKNILVDNIARILEPFQERRRELAEKNEYVREVLREGGKKAHRIISITVSEVREKMGITIY
ncbi:tryptophan--tRNA ligase [Candidatus Giovannonibacteria bacterium RIFCSPLOWO2_02_FULL_45_28]|uniref:Tryptophan--tRNA ligase n=1 Tax=Candidatus Doudnabacteria bacterium RIFCSPHIGHO2_01_52_17 TaxID=1817820 RepID=A0A1F5NAD3_9BACT|nr:MAG: tryptophan--tRNA ligase [Candidatus Doudnabacteria bacterium RIFCSPHIGHO2_01_52_17]OGF87417.1 MAG: tryptophan--tRNA ligase [Candidatus Giovannonibacteria bacterium RIFCSPLOWO2_02_FULL_45_28]